MSTSKSSDKESAENSPESVTVLIKDIGDTTWRMFLPSIGLTLGGIAIDRMFGSKPFGMIVGIVLGSLIAALLVRTQLRKVK